MRLDSLKRRASKHVTHRHTCRPTLERLEDKLAPAVFTVVNTNDSGPGSLRQAMFDAESTPNTNGIPDEVHFAIPVGGVQVIHPGGSLPDIVDPVIIDGYTQPGASVNTLAVGDNAVLRIEINGSSMSLAFPDLFRFRGNGSMVRGLAITHVPGSSFDIGAGATNSNNNTIAGNFIGTDAGGSTYLADNGLAINIGHSSLGVFATGNRIGGTAPADRNVITSAGASMILLRDAFNNFIQGNYIGVTKDGTAALQSPLVSTIGVGIGNGAHDNTIGGTVTGAGNVILGTQIGIGLFEGSTGGNVVQGNFIGTNATGTAALFGGTGIFVNTVSGVGDTIGGSASGAGNLISGNTTGIESANGSPGPTIQGNRIGTDVTGTSAVPNSGDGILVTGVRGPGPATIGGTGPGEGNTIAFNGGCGVQMINGAGRSFLGNSIFANGKRGIRLFVDSNDTQTVNDPGDPDTGANGFQNYPVITSATAGSSTTITGTLNSTPNTTFRVELFASDAADPSGFGEGQRFLGFTNVTTDGNGDASFSATLPGAVGVGQVVSATATDSVGNTSEFSATATVTPGSGNTAPAITNLDGPTIGVRGQPLDYTGSFSDPDADAWTATVNFGDGSGDQPLALNPDQTFAFNHEFTGTGTYDVVVTVADNHGGVGTRSLTVTISVVALETDPINPGQTILAVGGTIGPDVIAVSRRNSLGMFVTVNGISSGPYNPTSRVEVYGQAGNDAIALLRLIALPARVSGGDGDDTITGGREADTFLGGDGDDLLRGRGGNDFLYGGAGNDRLEGGNGDDTLQGGTGFLDRLIGFNGDDVLTDPDGVVAAMGGKGNDDITITFASGWRYLDGSLTLPTGALSGGDGDDTVRLTSNNSEMVFSVLGRKGNDRIELHGTWETALVFGGNGTDTLMNRGIGLLDLHGIEILE